VAVLPTPQVSRIINARRPAAGSPVSASERRTVCQPVIGRRKRLMPYHADPNMAQVLLDAALIVAAGLFRQAISSMGWQCEAITKGSFGSAKHLLAATGPTNSFRGVTRLTHWHTQVPLHAGGVRIAIWGNQWSQCWGQFGSWSMHL
jgi:hypothetical protein